MSVDYRLAVRAGSRRPLRRPRVGSGPSAAALLGCAELAIYVLGLALFTLANWRAHQAIGWTVAINDGLTVLFLICRRSTQAVSRSPSDWALAVLGTLGGLLMRPGGEPLAPHAVALVLAFDGAAIQVLAKLSLNRSFGLAPANRGVQDRGVYRVIRHPMYLGYLLIHAAYLLANPTPWNAAIALLTWAAQFGRISREERFLMRDPAYRRYAQRVRYRLAPLLF